jgi:hypothetical protein
MKLWDGPLVSVDACDDVMRKIEATKPQLLGDGEGELLVKSPDVGALANVELPWVFWIDLYGPDAMPFPFAHVDAG